MDEACWIELFNRTGCPVQIPAYHVGYWDNTRTPTWTGQCVKGLAQGSGTLESKSGQYTISKHSGHLQAGKYHREWAEDHTLGPSASYYDGTGSYEGGGVARPVARVFR